MKKISPLNQFKEYILSIGGVKQDKAYSDYQFQIETIYGLLRISVHESDFTKMGEPRKKIGNLVSIYCSFISDKCIPFLQQKENKKFIYNYKWNFNISGGNSPRKNWDYMFDLFKFNIEQILIK